LGEGKETMVAYRKIRLNDKPGGPAGSTMKKSTTGQKGETVKIQPHQAKNKQWGRFHSHVEEKGVGKRRKRAL